MARATVNQANRRAAKRRPSATKKDARGQLNFRVKPDVMALFDHAAEVSGKNRSDFILDAARQAAQNTLLDRSAIPVSEKAYAAFVAMLDAPPKPNARLLKTLQTPAVWE
jgi:uncharacterized protein (DUF1778 family)